MDRKIIFPDLALVDDTAIHVVKPGETLKRIAKSYGVKIHELYEANLGIHFGGLCAGLRILIPDPAAKPGTVSERDTTAFELQYRAKARVIERAKAYWEGILKETFELESVAK